MQYYAITDDGYTRPIYPDTPAGLTMAATQANCRYAVAVEQSVVRHCIERTSYGWFDVRYINVGGRIYREGYVLPNEHTMKTYGFVRDHQGRFYIRIRNIRGRWQKLHHYIFPTLEAARTKAAQMYG